MKRRGFLGLMGGAVAAGPSMAKEALAGIESLAGSTTGVEASWSGKVYSTATGLSHGESYLEDAYDHGDWLRKEIAKIVGISEAEKREMLANISVHALDPDLAVNRSFSLSAKVEMQKRRELERDLAANKRNYTRELAVWLKRQALS